MKRILEYNSFLNYQEKGTYFGKFMSTNIYLYSNYFQWGKKKSTNVDTKNIRMIDIIRMILAMDSSLKIDNYRDFITYTLGYLYDKDVVNVGGIDRIKLQNFDEYNTDEKSILNYINTNRIVKGYLLKMYKETDENSSTFFKKIWTDKNELFLEGGTYFKIILDKLKYATQTGKKLEDNIVINTAEFFKKLLNDSNISLQFGTLQEDLLKGIDLKIVGKNYVKTIQVKPIDKYSFKSFKLEEFKTRVNQINNNDYTDRLNKEIIKDLTDDVKVFEMSSTSVTKHYDTDYLIFTKESEKKIFVLANKDLILDESKHNYIFVNPEISKEKANEFEIIYLYK